MGLEGTLALGCQFEERYFAYIGCYLLERQGLVVNGQTSNHLQLDDLQVTI